MEKKDKIQIATLILIAVLIVVLIMAIVILSKNVDEIKSDPVQYSIDNGFYDSCVCSNQQFNRIVFGNKMVTEDWTG